MDKWKFHQAQADGTRAEIGGTIFFIFWRAIYDSVATGADNDQLWAPLFSLSGTLLAHQKDLIMTLYRCQARHFWGSPAGLTWHMTCWPATIWDSWAGELRGEEVEGRRGGQLTPRMVDLRNTSSRNPISLIYIHQMVKGTWMFCSFVVRSRAESLAATLALIVCLQPH